MILLSGGLDSAVLCATLPEESEAVFFDYGQENLEEERSSAVFVADKLSLNLSHYCLPRPAGFNAETRLLFGRNSLFALYAASISTGSNIYIGANRDDFSDYPDCRQSWLDAINSTLACYGGRRVVAPFLYQTKSEVVKLGMSLLGSSFLDKTRTCYTRGRTPCESCPSCRTRALAFAGDAPPESYLYVNEHFESIQGEGRHAGTPQSFIRLQGCSVGCSFCDTKHTWNPKRGWKLTPEQCSVLPKLNSVCITGGEPAQQNPRAISELVRLLHQAEKTVSVETSGIGKGLDSVLGDVWLTLSPKLHALNRINRKCVDAASEFKFVLTSPEDIPIISDFSNGKPQPIYLQPCDIPDDPDQANFLRELAIRECMSRGWNLSLQLHKIIGLP